MALGASLTACQTAPAAHSGFLSSYEGLAPSGDSLRAVVSQRRSDAASDAVTRIFIHPAVLASGAGEDLSEAERRSILRAVDREVCFEISERFPVVHQRDAETAEVRTSVVRIRPTGRIGSGVSAVANFFNPVPVVNLRAPGSTGGLAVESELLAPGTGEQIAAITWGRDANVVGMDSPSLSRIGDALQFAEPMGDAVGDAFASEAREEKPIPDPDPCRQHGPRQDIARSVGGIAVGLVTGLYVPEIEQAPAPGPDREPPHE